MSTEVKRGYLSRLKGGMRLGAKRKWVKLVENGQSLELRLEIYGTEKAARDGEGAKEEINMSHAKLAIRTSKHKYTFLIQLEGQTGEQETMTFSSDSDTDADDWVDAINRLLMQNHSSSAQRRNNPMQPPVIPPTFVMPSMNGRPTVLGDGRFVVFPTVLHEKLRCRPGESTVLKVTTDRISLLDEREGLLVDWGLSALRRYGNTHEYFQFEAGRRTTTGEGVFTFMTKDGQQVYDIVHRYTQEMVSRSSTRPPLSSSSSHDSATQVPTVQTGRLDRSVSINSAHSSGASSASTSLRNSFLGDVAVVADGGSVYQGLASSTRAEQPAYTTTGGAGGALAPEAPPTYVAVIEAERRAQEAASNYQPLDQSSLLPQPTVSNRSTYEVLAVTPARDPYQGILIRTEPAAAPPAATAEPNYQTAAPVQQRTYEALHRTG